MPADIHGRLGAQSLAAATDTTLYTCPTGRKATATVSLCNRSATATTVRLAMPDGALGTLANEDYLEYDVELPGNGTLERDRITVAAGHTLIVRSAAATVTAVAFGIEEDA
jgi:hypothetical protein